MKSLARRISDRHLLHLLKQWLEMPVEDSVSKRRFQAGWEWTKNG
jgi:hypothetical protein